VPYVGADVTASSMGIDKRAMKQAFKARGLPQVPYLPVRGRGTTRSRSPSSTRSRQRSLPDVHQARPPGLVDRDHDGAHRDELARVSRRRSATTTSSSSSRGSTVPASSRSAVLGNEDLEVTAPARSVPSHEFYDFEAKYLDESELRVPADVTPDVAARIDDIAGRPTGDRLPRDGPDRLLRGRPASCG
jgi:D-alanine-D-alanine ligase